MTLNDLILHHYPNSPFSEKIRLILGHLKLSWRSVIIPVIMPKPDVIALTGGYRRTPVMQIGADIFCDTALMAHLISDQSERGNLFPVEHPEAESLAEWIDSALFQVAVSYVFQPAAFEVLMAGQTEEQIAAFMRDRATMRGSMSTERPTPEAAGAALRVYLPRFQAGLAQTGGYLLDEQSPSIADFSLYHLLWFIARVPPITAILDDYPAVRAWMDRMSGCGHGDHDALDSTNALQIAREAQPAITGAGWCEIGGLQFGDRVTVTPTDYGLDPVAGELTISEPNRMAIRREDERAGEVQVHFPRLGYRIAAQQ